jgi:hypothetical protein
VHPQLQEIADDFEAARLRLRALALATPDARWAARPAPERWSPAECVAHLNLTTEAYRPIVADALARARALGRPAPARYRRDLLGWMLWRTMAPPVRIMKVKTPPAFVPSADQPKSAVLAAFERLQDEQIDWVRAADGLPLGGVKLSSPFAPAAKYNLFACLGILPRHQHRHLWQAEQAALAAAAAHA